MFRFCYLAQIETAATATSAITEIMFCESTGNAHTGKSQVQYRENWTELKKEDMKCNNNFFFHKLQVTDTTFNIS